MNRIYRLVFNHALGVTQVASETTVQARASAARSGHASQARRSVLAAAVTGALLLASTSASASVTDWSYFTNGNAAQSPYGGNGGAGSAYRSLGGGYGGGGGNTTGSGGSNAGPAANGNGSNGMSAGNGTGGAGGYAGLHMTVAADGWYYSDATGLNGSNGTGRAGGGGGGAAVFVVNDGTEPYELELSGTYVGGNGGNGALGTNSQSGYGGGGGGGGAGLYVSAYANVLTDSNTIIRGGTGGVGGYGGASGSGGTGAMLVSNASMSNHGLITGGAGGYDSSISGSVGAGASGVLIAGDNATFINYGTVAGNTYGASQSSAIQVYGDNNTVGLSGPDVQVKGGIAAYGVNNTLQLDGNFSVTTSINGFDLIRASDWSNATFVGDYTSNSTGTGTPTFDVGSNANLAFRYLIVRSNNPLDPTFSTSGALDKTGDGTLTVTGFMSAKPTVDAGTLALQTNASADATTVNAAGTISGMGTVNGLTVVGGTVAPGLDRQVGTLTVSSLTMNQGHLAMDADAPGTNDLLKVTGDANIQGSVVDVNNLGNMGAGVYRVLTYGGTINDNGSGLTLGNTSGENLALRYIADEKAFDIVDSGNVTLAWWNADGTASATHTGGGTGSWSLTSPTFADATGANTGPMDPQPGFAIFGGEAGTVYIDSTDGPVSATGMQFMTDGYRMSGDSLSLVSTNGEAPIIRVGDGSLSGAGITATIDNTLTGTNGLVKTDEGTLLLNGTNLFSGDLVVKGGVLAAYGDPALGDASNAITLDGGTLAILGQPFLVRRVNLGTSGGTLAVDGSLHEQGLLTGQGALHKTGSGTLWLDTDNTYDGGTFVDTGAVAVGSDHALGTGTVTLANATGLALNADQLALDNDIYVTGAASVRVTGDATLQGNVTGDPIIAALQKSGNGQLTIEGELAAHTTVAAGTLLIGSSAGTQAVADAGVDVLAGGTVGGHGQVIGGLTVDGGTLSPGKDGIGTLTVDNLVLNNAHLAIDADAPGNNDVIAVTGDANIQNSVVDVNNLGGMGAGIYHFLTVGGNVIAGDMTLGETSGRDLSLRYVSDSKMFDIVDSTGVTLNYWNGNGQASQGNYGGGDGTWSATSATFADESGQFTGVMAPQPGFAVFTGTAGTVAVDGSAGAVGTTGMQFATNGYHLTGDAISLVGSGQGDAPAIRVGDGTNNGTEFSATIDNVLTGTDGLAKTDFGTLTLNGDNTFSGGVSVTGGTLAIASDAALGDAANGVTLDGGTLHTLSSQATDRVFTLGPNGGVFSLNDAYDINGTISGTGSLLKTGSGTLNLDTANTYAGGTSVLQGRVQASDSSSFGTGLITVVNDGSIGLMTDGMKVANDMVIQSNNSLYTVGTDTLTGWITGMSSQSLLVKTGAGALVVDGTMDVNTEVSEGTLIIGGNDNSTATARGVLSEAGTTVGGFGDITGYLTVLDGTLSPGMGAIGTLSVGNLNLVGSHLAIDADAPGTSDLIKVTGAAYLRNSVVDVTNLGNMGAGVYRILEAASVNDNGSGLTLGDTDGRKLTLRYLASEGAFDLIDRTGIILNYWNADGQASATQMGGGSGTWTANSANFADATGQFTDAMDPQPGFAVFGGTAGLVQVNDGAGVVSATGMQFMTSNYRLTGDTLQLVAAADGTAPTIRVGDGTSNGANFLASIVNPLAGTDGLVKTDAGTLLLETANTFSGGVTVNGGSLVVRSDLGLGDASNSVTLDGGTLQDLAPDATQRAFKLESGGGTISTDLTYEIDGQVTGDGTLYKTGNGSLLLNTANDYTGGTVVKTGGLYGSDSKSFGTGTITLEDGTTFGMYAPGMSVANNVTLDGKVAFMGNGVDFLTGTVSAGTPAAELTKSGGSSLVIDGALNVATSVSGGALVIGSTKESAGKATAGVSISNGAYLAGFGSITGGLSVTDGTVLPGINEVGKLTVDNLTLDNALLDIDASTPGISDRVVVTGDASINNSVVDVTNLGGMGAGVYRFMTVGGDVTGNGFTLGDSAGETLSLRYRANEKAFDLVDTTGVTLNYWDADGKASATQMGGGTGTWSNTSLTFADADGKVDGAMAPQPGFAVFGGDVGTVSVDNSAGNVAATGMQFMTDGYHLTGDALSLVAAADGTAPTIRVGDGTSTGASTTATIDNVLTGTDGLVKADAGTLALNGENTFSGDVAVTGGTLAIARDSALGDAANGVTLDGGTLHAAATALGTDRTIELGTNGGTLAADGYYVVSGRVTGDGALHKAGNGEVMISSANAYGGGTYVDAGALYGADSKSFGGGTIHMAADTTLGLVGDGMDIRNGVVASGNAWIDAEGVNTTISGTISDGDTAGTLRKEGDQMLTLTGNNTFSGGVVVDGGTLAVASDASLGASTGSVTLNGGTLQTLSPFNSSRAVVLGNGESTLATGLTAILKGTVSGTGTLHKADNGVLMLDAANSYEGGTVVDAGSLYGSHDTSFGTGNISLGNNTLLGLMTDGMKVANDITVNGAVSIKATGTNVLSGSVSTTSTTASIKKTGDSTLVVDGTLGVATYATGGAVVIGSTKGSDAVATAGVSVKEATLGGFGSITGGAYVYDGTLSAGLGQIGTLTVDDLTMDGSHLAIDADAKGMNDLVKVSGNASLNDTIVDVNNLGNMGAGVYRFMTVGGDVSGNALTLGETSGQSLYLRYLADDKAFDIVDTTGVVLNYWNGNGAASATAMGGGDGTWSVTSKNFADADGQFSDVMQPQPGFAVFGGQAGTVAVDNTAGDVAATGMQFMTDGYHLTGGTLSLAGTNGAAPVIRVGDGTTAGASITATIDNVLTGTDGLVKTDAGTLVLNGENTFSGDVAVNGGTLAINSDTALGDAANNVTLDGGTLHASAKTMGTARKFVLAAGNGTLTVDGDYVASGIVSGEGALHKAGNGTLTLGGDNTYSGGTYLDAGSLVGTTSTAFGTGDITMAENTVLGFGADGMNVANRIIVAGDPTIDVADGTSSTLSGAIVDGTSAGDIVKTGGGTLRLTAANTYTGGTVVSGGKLIVGDGATSGSLVGNVVVDTAGTLAFDRSDDVTFGGNISGDGNVQKLGSNTLTLSGDNSAFTGTTSVAGGVLDLSGSLGGALVLSQGAILTGSGSLGEVTVQSGTSMTPGGDNAIDTFSVAGNLAFAAGSSYVVNTAEDGTSDTVNVTGTATLGGADVKSIQGSGTYKPNTRYTILTANGGVDGMFGSLSSNLAFLTPSLAYDATHVYLDLKRNDIAFASMATNANQLAAANAAQSQGDGKAVYDAVVALDASAVPAALGNLDGEALASARTALVDDARQVREAVQRHVLTAGSDGAWTSVWGHWGDHGGSAGVDRLRSNGGGVLFGADRDLGGFSLGATVGTGNVTARSGADSVQGTSRVAGLYAAAETGAWQWQAGVMYGWNRLDSHRTVSVEGLAGRASARYDANTAQGYVDGGYKFTFNTGSLTPFVNVARVQVDQDAIHERNSDAALDVRSQNDGVTLGTAGLRGSLVVGEGISAHATLAYQQAWGDVRPANTQRFVTGGDNFTVVGAPVARHAGLADAGFTFAVGKNTTVDASYHGLFGGGSKDQGARLGLTVKW